jgi:hypothetical protein
MLMLETRNWKIEIRKWNIGTCPLNVPSATIQFKGANGSKKGDTLVWLVVPQPVRALADFLTFDSRLSLKNKPRRAALATPARF